MKYQPNSLEANMIDTIFDTLGQNLQYPQIKEGNIEDFEVDSTKGEIEIYYWLDEVYTEIGSVSLPEKKLMRVTMSLTVEQVEGE